MLFSKNASTRAHASFAASSCMTDTAFAYTLRMLVCPRCGAPIRVPLEGGEVECSYCKVVSVLTARREAPERIRREHVTPPTTSAVPLDEEGQRLAMLRAQRDDRTRVSRYDIARVPPGLERFAQGTLVGKLEAVRGEWAAARANYMPGASSLEDQRRMYYLTHLVRSAAAYDDKPEVGRAVAETTLDLLDDPGFRHGLRCMMAGAAVRAGDADAAEGWLSACDPTPDELALDSDYRVARANIALARGDSRAVLTVLGESHDAFPFEAASAPVATLYRIHAFEKLGALDRARAEMAWLCGQSFPAGGGAIIAKQIIGVQQWRELCSGTASMPEAAHRSAVRTLWIVLGVIGVVIGLVVGALTTAVAGVAAGVGVPVALLLTMLVLTRQR